MPTVMHRLPAYDSPAPDGRAPIGIAAACLPNGLQIVVIPDRRSPVVTHMVWYRTGAAEDPPGRSGTAHFLEHLMFKGTARYPAGAFSAFLGGIGGQENAFTSWNYTCYHQQVPRPHLRACMAFEADRMERLLIDPAVAATERAVILEERATVADGRPQARLEEAMAAAFIPEHPAGRPIIGWRHEIADLAAADAQAYHGRFYVPANAILIVAGDTTIEEVVQLADDAYGPVPSGEAFVRRPAPNPLPPLGRRITLADARVRQPQMQRLHAVPGPAAAAPGEAEALTVLCHLLGGGRTSTLQRRLVVEQRCASSVGAYYLSEYFAQQSRCYLVAEPVAGVTPEALDDAVEATLEVVRDTGFAPAAIARAKTQLVADLLYARDSQVQLASWYGRSLALGASLADLAGWQDRIEAVTPAALAAALTLLDRRHGVSGYLVGG